MTTTVHVTRHNQKIYIIYQGRSATLKEWADLTGKPYHTLYSRFKANPAPEHVFKGITITNTNDPVTETAAV